MATVFSNLPKSPSPESQPPSRTTNATQPNAEEIHTCLPTVQLESMCIRKRAPSTTHRMFVCFKRTLTLISQFRKDTNCHYVYYHPLELRGIALSGKEKKQNHWRGEDKEPFAVWTWYTHAESKQRKHGVFVVQHGRVDLILQNFQEKLWKMIEGDYGGHHMVEALAWEISFIPPDPTSSTFER